MLRAGHQFGRYGHLRRFCRRDPGDELCLYCRGQIARYKIPKYIFFIDEFPMTASGKIQKYRLRDLGVEMLEERGVTIV